MTKLYFYYKWCLSFNDTLVNELGQDGDNLLTV